MARLFRNYRILTLLLGDLLILWAGLLVVLGGRYGFTKFDHVLQLHVLPFSIVFAMWLTIFYISGLYDVRNTQETATLLRTLIYTVATNGILAMMLFYFVPFFIITPKINLMLDIGLTAALLTAWRLIVARFATTASKVRVLLFGDSSEINELASAITRYPQLGYHIAARAKTIHELSTLLQAHTIEIVVAPKDAQIDTTFVHTIYDTLHRGVRFIDAATFYEKILGKIPVTLISKTWFLENIAETEKYFFESIKRGFDILFAIILGTITIVTLPIVILIITLDSRGPLFIRQKRVGRHGKEFILYKYRTMIALSPDGLAETHGAVWAEKNDKRVTRMGKILRTTRIDELPQLWNVLRGDLSFIGPRPERPEFVRELALHIPYYEMRNLVRPGLSGWAQINPPYYYGTDKEALLKLQYDLYYIKNRDLGLDLEIVLKTLAVILSARGR
ncbi:MAG: exopolysaccharide biosynthesis polyprenyl glycosylphosphotransferase [Patescibacteria group bacterium]